MKLLYIANSYVPSKTANSIHVMKMCRSFALVGHDVTLITFDSSENEESNVENVFAYYGVEQCFSIKKIALRKLKGKMHLFAFEAIKFALAFKPDIVYTRCEIPAVYLSFTKIPFVIEAHKPFINQKGVMGYLFRRIFKARNLKRFVAISNVLKQMFLIHFKQDIDSLVLHDAADIPQLDDQLTIKWKGRTEALQLGYFGHLYPGRGVDVIIELAKSNQDADFHIVGGRQKDVDYWREQLVGLSNIYIHGFIEPSEVAQYRNRCDVLLAPYQREVWVENKGHESSKYMSPLKIFEYMSSKKCIICSDIPVLREVLNNENSLLVSPDKIEEWNAAIKKAFDEDFRNRLAIRAFEDLKAKYTWNKRAELSLEGIKNG
ncbi:glycosyltransferase family 4 protein [Carboxylicivirga marina]|uniref:Glycosyltransferase family 4 protein n=1 Tax=Carboxylicivirga marina TaxID=2800988 RepID=A0ABS1HQV8_9BACT|nr:glycosyltransferase family 4 protein [Carboxylicivirga marina]MBK3519937.1 glycosyltransferase family 4 protein [Carboxylicivirga marina]